MTAIALPPIFVIASAVANECRAQQPAASDVSPLALSVLSQRDKDVVRLAGSSLAMRDSDGKPTGTESPDAASLGGMTGIAGAISTALQSYPGIRAAGASVSAQEANVDQARYGHWPTVGYQATRQIASDDPINLPTGFSGSPVMKLNLYAGGSINATIRAQRSKLDEVKYQVMSEQDTTALNVAQAYIDWFRASESLRYALENEQRHEKLVADIGEMAKIDRGRAADYQQALVRLSSAKQTVVDYQGLQRQAASSLLRYTGSMPKGVPSLEDPVIDRMPVPDTLPHAQENAVSAHPDVRAAFADWQYQQGNVSVAKASLLPRVDLTAATKGRSVGITMTWTGFDMAARSAVKTAQYSAISSRESYEEAGRKAVDGVTSAWAAYERAKDRLPMAQSQDQLGLQVADSYRLQFQIGRRTLLDLLNSYSELLSNQVNAVQTQADLAVARYSLQAALGQLYQGYSEHGGA
ncbi:TolC family protein [Paraburkholderia sediminicola]|uniref:TolC family protein n=1 Tax=Paraburkholderia rhynchosiae TaxID=487049 RepID=A0ACC7NQC3_9BURK